MTMKNGNDQVEITEDLEIVSKSVRILDLIAAAGKTGMRYSEIQEALWNMSHDTPFRVKAVLPYGQGKTEFVNRGYWSTNLCPLLHYFCEQNADRRYVRNRYTHRGHPWSTLRTPVARQRMRAKQDRNWEAYKAKHPERFEGYTCPDCSHDK